MRYPVPMAICPKERRCGAVLTIAGVSSPVAPPGAADLSLMHSTRTTAGLSPCGWRLTAAERNPARS